MSESQDLPGAEVWFDRGARRFAPHQTLAGEYRLGGWRDEGLVALEFSVLWYTAGQGDEDFFVHHFESRREAALPKISDETPHQFHVPLPASPLSYDGRIVKVCWAVRLRGFFPGGRQRVIEEPFWLTLTPERSP